MATLKEQKELFVSGHDGTVPQELILVCCTVPVGFWCGSLLLNRFSIARIRPLSVELVTLWIPMILCQSNMLYPWGVIYLILEIMIAMLLELYATEDNRSFPEIPEQQRLQRQQQQQQQQQQHKTQWKSDGVASYRSALMYLTFVAILAVDFPFFPRRFAKTETQGYGLMDLGAASFVIAAGLVSPRARKKKEKTNGLQEGTVRRVLPLVVMGLLRLLTHKGIEYQEHASEYGVHWNFFFTLALLPLLVGCLPGPGWITPTLIMVGYQSMLSSGLQEWIEQAPRECETSYSTFCHLFFANREGILGCFGYASLYMTSEWIGAMMWAKDSPIFSLWAIWGLFGCLWCVLCSIIGVPVSRRSTNTSFCCWALVVNVPILASSLSINRRHEQVSLVSRAVNRHGLICFIVANLLTGIVNISINTMEVTDAIAMSILIAYMMTVGKFASILDAVLQSNTNHACKNK